MSALIPTLEALLSAEQVISREQINDQLGSALRQTTHDGSLPGAVVYPTTEAELAAIVACAYQHRWRVLPCGSGSKLTWGGLAQGFDLVISTQRLNHLVEHAVGDMTLTAAAGLRLADLKPQLAQHHQFLAIDPAYPDRATLGGIVATADTGSLRQRYNSVRDMLIGISFVRYDGQLAKAGGRVVKNVAGYDLMKLMTGAYGSLGILSQLTFRLYPTPAASKTVVISGPAADIAILTADLRQSSLTPVALDVLSPHLAAVLGLPLACALALRFQSNAPGVEEQVHILTKMTTTKLTLQEFTDTADADFWERQTAALFPAIDGWDDAGALGLRAKLGVLPSHAVDLLTQIHRLVAEDSYVRIHAGSGIGTLSLSATTATPDLVKAIRQACQAARGYCTVLQATKTLKQSLDVWDYSDSALPLMRGIKAKFDPHQLLSPGRFVGGL